MSQELKYKVGDRVRVAESRLASFQETGVVEEVDPSKTGYPYRINFGDCWSWVSESWIVRAEPDARFKVGDRVKSIYTSSTAIGIGTVVEAGSLGTGNSYCVQFGMWREWLDEHALTRAASSPDEQDIENAGGSDPVNHPSHYTSDPSGIECITITRHRDFLVGNAIKYLWRAGLKESDNPGKETEDLQKAVWYIQQRIELIGGDK